ncbi:MAG: CTP synthase [Chloroflexi bacterium]|nr:CTP synthase [Chloroflexota bacterium]
MTKYIFVTGGVASSVGKGITVASLGAILKSKGLSVSVQKMDPYLNVDPGTMSPYQHGEVFVTKDGAETDLDLGNYERFIDIELTAASSVTSGKIYSRLIAKERKGEYLGGTIQVVPHLVNEIKGCFCQLAEESQADVVIVEVGGTVGDIEGQPFLEAIRQMRKDAGRENVCYIHVTLLPHIGPTGELKTKPTQHSVGELRRIGIQPDVIVLRADRAIPEEIRDKVALFCDVEKEAVIFMPTAPSIYDVPLVLEKEGMGQLVGKILNIQLNKTDVTKWQKITDNINNLKGQVNIALVGKYVELQDAYYSVREALSHAAIENGTGLNIIWVQSQDLEKEGGERLLEKAQGIIVPGGFGDRGIEGKIAAAKYAREHNIPYLGLCLGMQIMVIEFARYVLDTKDCTSTEFNICTAHPVIDILETQKEIGDKGGTMRLGNYPCLIKEGTQAKKAYGCCQITERHRHRFEFNNRYSNLLEENGLLISGISPDGSLAEICEIKHHPFMVACQFHPEFLSRPGRPHPLFNSFIQASQEVVLAGSQTKMPLE